LGKKKSSVQFRFCVKTFNVLPAKVYLTVKGEPDSVMHNRWVLLRQLIPSTPFMAEYGQNAAATNKVEGKTGF